MPSCPDFGDLRIASFVDSLGIFWQRNHTERVKMTKLTRLQGAFFRFWLDISPTFSVSRVYSIAVQVKGKRLVIATSSRCRRVFASTQGKAKWKANLTAMSSTHISVCPGSRTGRRVVTQGLKIYSFQRVDLFPSCFVNQ